MPKIKIKRGSWHGADQPELEFGEIAYNTNGNRLRVGAGPDGSTDDGDSVTVKGADYASKIGEKDSQSQIGSSTQPVYVESDGTVTPSNASVGGLDNPLMLKDGSLIGVAGTYPTSDATVYHTMGAEDTNEDEGRCFPVYVSGTKSSSDPSKYNIAGLRHTAKFAGGTRVTLNGTNKGHEDATIYAPSYAPASGSPDHKIAVYDNGQSGAVWSNDNVGNITNPVYIKDGAIKEFAGYYDGSDYDIVEQIMADSDTQGAEGEYYPVYVSGTLNPPEGNATIGGIKHSPKYAGGSRVKMNGSADNKYESDPVIYAPSSGGTAGQVLVSNGAGNAPYWENLLRKTYASTGLGDVGSYNVTVHGIYIFLIKESGLYRTVSLIYPLGTPVGTVLESEDGTVSGTVINEGGVVKLSLSTYDTNSAKFTALYRVAEFDS